MDSAYHSALRRVQESLYPDLAMCTLMWLTFVKRPLSVPELQHALAIEYDARGLDQEKICDIGDIISTCAGLVICDEEENIRLVYFITQEHLRRVLQEHIANPEEKIAMSCLTYLNFDMFSGICCKGHWKGCLPFDDTCSECINRLD